MNDESEFTQEELRQIIDQNSERVSELEDCFIRKDSLMYYILAIGPVLLVVFAIGIAATGDGSFEDKQTAREMLITALLGAVVFRIDRVLEYLQCRFDIYDAMSVLEDEVKNEQPDQG